MYYAYPGRVELTTEKFTDSNGHNPLSMDSRGNVLVGYSHRLLQSTQLCRDLSAGTYDTIYEFESTPDKHMVRAAKRMSNGEILCVIENIVADPKYLEVYTVDDSNPADITATLRLTTDTETTVTIQYWQELLDVQDNVAVLGTYGPGADGVHKQYIFLSRDYGRNWVEIWGSGSNDPTVLFGDATYNYHVHSVKIDPFRPYIWAAVGDGNNAAVIYTWNYGKTWHGGRIDSDLLARMSINVYPMQDYVLVDTDAPPDGIYRFNFTEETARPLIRDDSMTCHLISEKAAASYKTGYWGKGVVDYASTPNRILLPFGRPYPDYETFTSVLMTYDGVHFYMINGINRKDAVQADLIAYNDTTKIGDVRVEYLVGISPSDFKIGENGAGNVAVGYGYYWSGSAWVGSYINFNVPEWKELKR